MRRVTAIVLALCVVGAAVAVRGQNRIASGSTYHTIEAQNVMPYSTWTACLLWATCDLDPSNTTAWTVQSYDSVSTHNDGAQTTAGNRPAYTKTGTTGYLTLDGVDDCVALSDTPFDAVFGDSQVWTVMAWIKPATSNMTGNIIAKMAGFDQPGITVRSAGGRLNENDVGAGSGNPYRNVTSSGWISNTVNWTHVAAVSSGTASNEIVFYINGASNAVTYGAQGGSGSRVNNETVFVGKRSNGLFFSGSIDDVRVFTSALSPLIVSNIWEATRARHP